MSLRSIGVIVLALVASGCAQVNLATWKRSVEQYVNEHGNGNPSVLRNVTLPDERRGFALYSRETPRRSTDINGLLVAHRIIDDRPWLIFMVGEVDKQRVTDIRLVGLSVENGNYAWRVSPSDSEALNTYRRHHRAVWRERFPDRPEPSPAYRTFPRPEDVFDLDASHPQITATHGASGARWELSLYTSAPVK